MNGRAKAFFSPSNTRAKFRALRSPISSGPRFRRVCPEGEELEATDYYAQLYEKMDLLGMDRSFTSRSVNEGFSGGEKKRNEILQMAMLEPKYAMLDETDSGLDIDALKIVAHGVNSLRGPNLGVLLITHYQRLLNYIVPDHVHVMVRGTNRTAAGARIWPWNWKKRVTIG